MNTNEAPTIFTIGEIELSSGVGSLKDASLCVMAAARAIHDIENNIPLAEATDELECACPVVRALCIARNDSFTDDKERTDWGLRLIPHIIGSRDDAQTQARAFRCVDVAVREIAAGALDKAGIKHALRDLPPIIDEETARQAQTAAYSAAYSAHAAAYAAAHADAANSAANAAYYAAANAWHHIDALIYEFLGITKDTPADHPRLQTRITVPA